MLKLCARVVPPNLSRNAVEGRQGWVVQSLQRGPWGGIKGWARPQPATAVLRERMSLPFPSVRLLMILLFSQWTGLLRSTLVSRNAIWVLFVTTKGGQTKRVCPRSYGTT